jgi:hypothetical protein
MIGRNLCLLGAIMTLAGIGASSSAARIQSRGFRAYLKVTRFQYINHADDRARGDITSPFDPDAALKPPPNANSGAKGTRAGDQAVFAAKLYSDQAMKKLIGTATYTCTFNFGQQATCQADFQLRSGTMFASGPADLTTGRFTLAIIGGTSGYIGSRGQVTTIPTGKPNTARDDFELVG